MKHKMSSSTCEYPTILPFNYWFSPLLTRDLLTFRTYYGSVDVAGIEDEGLRTATELQIAHFGQCPMQLFYRPHTKRRFSKSRHRQTLSELYCMKSAPLIVKNVSPFVDAPLSYWTHLGAPPPGPHAPLISIRLALTDRCLAVDSRGVFHFFRWAWKADMESSSRESESTNDDVSPELEEVNVFADKGCFVAQREWFSFRNIPQLPFATEMQHVAVGVSNTLFANRSLLLVVSDGDGEGALAMQLVDPIKGEIRGEAIVPSVHAGRVTCIDMDPIGTAAGQGGVGGELAIIGSADGSATLWRFISSHYWPLRPRLRMAGHGGQKIVAVAVSSSLGICVSVSPGLCCVFDIGNGSMIRKFQVPSETSSSQHFDEVLEDDVVETVFADTSAMSVSVQGFLILVCSIRLIRDKKIVRAISSLELFSVDGLHLGSRLLEEDRGVPQKLVPTIDGRAVFVCAGGSASLHLVSSIQPLLTMDEWRLSNDPTPANKLSQCCIHDLDFGPTVARPVVAAVGCSDGSLRLHALKGISKWSEEHQKNSMTSTVGNILNVPAQTVKNAFGGVSSFGSNFLGSAKVSILVVFWYFVILSSHEITSHLLLPGNWQGGIFCCEG